MGLFREQRPEVPRHEPKHPLLEGELTFERMKEVFRQAEDFSAKTVVPALWQGEKLDLCWMDGLVKSERLNDYVLRPLCRMPAPAERPDLRWAEQGGLWNLSVLAVTTLDEAAERLLDGCCIVFFPDGTAAVSVPTEEKRSVSQPDNESEVKGAKDSFVESLRTNTSLIRRRVRNPFLCVRQVTVGRQTRTPVEVLWISSVADNKLPEEALHRLEEIDTDGVLTTGDLEEYLENPRSTLFPRMLFTERPDRFSQALLEGRIGLFADGIPLGCILPVGIARFLRAPQDESYHWAAATALLLLRWMCMLVTLLLPGFYGAVAAFHVELIPTQLAMSIIASEQDVPFTTAVQVLGLLAAFEILQEAGVRLPKTIGQTVSIIGGLVVGQAAVDAKVVSPVVVIVIAVAGIAGFTMPNQDFSNALRLWRFLLALLSAVLGIFGLVFGFGALIAHLAGLKSFGLSYLESLVRAKPGGLEQRAVIRQPIDQIKLRSGELHPRNLRKRG